MTSGQSSTKRPPRIIIDKEALSLNFQISDLMKNNLTIHYVYHTMSLNEPSNIAISDS